MRRGDRLGSADHSPSSDRRRHGFDAGFGRRLGLCAPVRPGLGARVIATTWGAFEVINYSETPDWDEKARELTDGRGVDCVVEIGGPGTIAKSLKALAVGGHVSLIGASLSPSGIMLDPLLLTGRGITVGAISVGSDEPGYRAAWLAPRDRSDIPLRRGQGGLPAFRGPRPFREGRDHARLMRRPHCFHFQHDSASWLCFLTLPLKEGTHGRPTQGGSRRPYFSTHVPQRRTCERPS
jgi:hypothetical protein